METAKTRRSAGGGGATTCSWRAQPLTPLSPRWVSASAGGTLSCRRVSWSLLCLDMRSCLHHCACAGSMLRCTSYFGDNVLTCILAVQGVIGCIATLLIKCNNVIKRVRQWLGGMLKCALVAYSSCVLIHAITLSTEPTYQNVSGVGKDFLVDL